MAEYDDNGLIADRPLPRKDWHTLAPQLPEGLFITRNVAPPGILVVQNYLDAASCDAIRRECDEIVWKKTQIVSKEEEASFVSSEARICDAAKAHELKTDVREIVRNAFAKVVGPHFKTELDTFESPEVLRYSSGGYYSPHSDADNWISTEKTWRRVMNRDLSLLLYLNSDFEGGELVFPNFGMRLKPQRGLLAAFPSDWRYAHGAVPTKSGVRFAIVSWAMAKGSARIPNGGPFDALPV